MRWFLLVSLTLINCKHRPAQSDLSEYGYLWAKDVALKDLVDPIVAARKLNDAEKKVLEDIFRKTLPATIGIVTGTGTLGSGFFIDGSGTFLTNHHVLDDSQVLTLVITDIVEDRVRTRLIARPVDVIKSREKIDVIDLSVARVRDFKPKNFLNFTSTNEKPTFYLGLGYPVTRGTRVLSDSEIQKLGKIKTKTGLPPSNIELFNVWKSYLDQGKFARIGKPVTDERLSLSVRLGDLELERESYGIFSSSAAKGASGGPMVAFPSGHVFGMTTYVLTFRYFKEDALQEFFKKLDPPAEEKDIIFPSFSMAAFKVDAYSVSDPLLASVYESAKKLPVNWGHLIRCAATVKPVIEDQDERLHFSTLWARDEKKYAIRILTKTQELYEISGAIPAKADAKFFESFDHEFNLPNEKEKIVLRGQYDEGDIEALFFGKTGKDDGRKRINVQPKRLKDDEERDHIVHRIGFMKSRAKNILNTFEKNLLTEEGRKELREVQTEAFTKGNGFMTFPKNCEPFFTEALTREWTATFGFLQDPSDK